MAETNDETSLTAKTPWGSLLTSKGAQLLVEGFTDDISKLQHQLKQLKKKTNHPNPDGSSIPIIDQQTNFELRSQIKELDDRIEQIDQRISELDERFTRFTTKALTLLNQLSSFVKK